MFLFITTSKGLYKYNLTKNKLSNVISNWHKGIFKKPSKGYFGICFNNDKNHLIVASREISKKKSSFEKGTDVILHFYDPINDKNIDKILINDLYDVHQIFYYNKKIYLTETGKNRIQIFNCENKKIDNFINIGNTKKNINHVNAIHVDKRKVLIGLNNGNKEYFKNAQIIEINTDIINDSKSEIDALEVGKVVNLNNIYHTHDIEKINDDYLISASEDGNLISYKNLSIVKKLPIFTRGIAISKKNVFIGKSGIATRKLRHRRYYNGKISVLDKDTFDLIKELHIAKIGQLNDILYYKN